MGWSLISCIFLTNHADKTYFIPQQPCGLGKILLQSFLLLVLITICISCKVRKEGHCGGFPVPQQAQLAEIRAKEVHSVNSPGNIIRAGTEGSRALVTKSGLVIFRNL